MHDILLERAEMNKQMQKEIKGQIPLFPIEGIPIEIGIGRRA